MSLKRHAPGSAYEALDKMMAEIGSKTGTNGYDAAGDFEDVSKFTIYKQLDPDQPRVEMSFARVVRLSKHFAVTAALRHFADQLDCLVLPRVSVSAGSCLISHLSALARESAEAVNATADLIADPNKTDAELAKAEKEARDLREAAAALEMAVKAKRQALQTGSVSTRIVPIRGEVA